MQAHSPSLFRGLSSAVLLKARPPTISISTRRAVGAGQDAYPTGCRSTHLPPTSGPRPVVPRPIVRCADTLITCLHHVGSHVLAPASGARGPAGRGGPKACIGQAWGGCRCLSPTSAGVCVPVCRRRCLRVGAGVCVSVGIGVCLSVPLLVFVCLSVPLLVFICLSVPLLVSVCLSVTVPLRPSVGTDICLSQSVGTAACASVCRSRCCLTVDVCPPIIIIINIYV
jgi:hypothetical protein